MDLAVGLQLAYCLTVAVVTYSTIAAVANRTFLKPELCTVYTPYVLTDRSRTRRWTVFRRRMQLV
jgi:hypothetical protein